MSEHGIRRGDEWHVVTEDELIAHLIREGWQDDEIVDHLPTPIGLRAQRELAARVARIRGNREITPSEILAARADDIQAGGRGGEAAVSRRLATTESTLQRLRTKYGLIPWPKD